VYGVWVPEEAAQANGLGAKEGKRGEVLQGVASHGKEGLELKGTRHYSLYKEENEECQGGKMMMIVGYVHMLILCG
jgi:hypothetical protein